MSTSRASTSRARSSKNDVVLRDTLNPLSQEFVETSESESEGDGRTSPDSDGDIDQITPRQRGSVEDPSSEVRRVRALPRYAPPRNMSAMPLHASLAELPFEYSQLEGSSRKELWAIRIPSDMKPSRLAGLSVTMERTSGQDTLGRLKLKSGTYTLVPVSGAQPEDPDSPMTRHAGNELEGGMRLLVPDAKRNGKLFASPIAIRRQLILRPEETPISKDTDQDDEMEAPRRSQPRHLFKFRNMAYGFDTPGPEQVAASETVPVSPERSTSKRERKDGKKEDGRKKRTKV